MGHGGDRVSFMTGFQSGINDEGPPLLDDFDDDDGLEYGD